METEKYMGLAIELAKKGAGYVSPNPMVGALIVKEGKIIGKGYHMKCGGPHGEINALANCSESPESSTLYVTLEPCCHWGKTPPCTEAIIKSGIKKVYMGKRDPNPLVAGKSVEILQKHGIQVIEGVLEEACTQLNRIFFHYIKKKTPYIMMKYAMTMDGKIATYTGDSKWITGELARAKVHEDRHCYKGIMVGSKTILLDNPLLTCRKSNGINPIRIVCDTHLSISLESQLVKTASTVETIIATACQDSEKQARYIKSGCKILQIPKEGNHLNLMVLMEKVVALGIDSILLEGGGTLNGSMLEAGYVNRIQTYIGPKIFGGQSAKGPIGGLGVPTVAQSFPLKVETVKKIGEDILIESEVVSCLQD